ncbi:MAG TPA: hypothetical protein VLH59_01435 [Ignavibacteriaceae bacterium]|nr:hypothetical protein [Ignavibacteriaceae bacterium]
MKKYIRTSLIILLLSAPFSFSQESEKPFIVSPLVGDTLSLEERNYYNLLPTVNGFQFAIFYLNADSLLDVRVSYKTRNGIKDTLISKYKSLANMRIYLFKVDIEMARKVTVYLENKTNIVGGFLAINHDLVLIYSEQCEEGTFNSNCLKKINNTEIRKFVIPGESNIGESVIWFTIIGMAVGSVTGVVINESTNGWEEFNAASALAGGLVGSCIGLLTGLIYGSVTSEPDIVIQPFSENNIKGLSQYSVYPNGEPEELKKIK